MHQPGTEAVSSHVQAAIAEVASMDVDPLRKAEAFVDLAIDLQKQPRHPQELFDALHLYGLAETASLEAGDALARARAVAGKGSALRRLPGGGVEALDPAQDAFARADIDDDVAVILALDATVDDGAGAILEFLELPITLGLADLLQDHLLGRLRRDPAHIDRWHFGD